MNILVDWLTISIKDKAVTVDKMLEILHLDKTKMVKGYSRYLGSRLFLGGISIHFGEYIILEMSGQGCRLLESLYGNKLDWIDFIEQFLCLEGSHLARLDIACDDYPGVGEKALLNYATMVRHVSEKRYLSLARYCSWIDGAEQAIYFGSPKSDRRLRIYNKAIERKYDGHWIRAEFQLRNDCALSFYMRALERDSIGEAYQGMMFDFLRFTQEKNKGENQDRMKVTRWWRTFCGNAARIKGFYVGGLEYNMDSLEHYLYKNAGSSMKTFLSVTGGDVGQLMDYAKDSKFNKKQEFLVRTQPLIQKMQADYATPEEKARQASAGSAAIIAELQSAKQHEIRKYEYEDRILCVSEHCGTDCLTENQAGYVAAKKQSNEKLRARIQQALKNGEDIPFDSPDERFDKL